ncbi:MAG: sulfatase-like hydrolase/transferase [Polyangiaceae bacterium]
MSISPPLEPQAETRSRWSWSFDALWVQAGAVLAAWFLLLVAENVAVTVAFGAELAGSWEMRATRRLVVPIALGALFPCALLTAAVVRLVARRRALLAALAGIGGGLTAWGVSNGRHMASLGVRVPFTAAVAAVTAGFAWWLGPILVRAARERPRVVALLGAVASVIAWCADERVLPRLYPAFHLALLFLTLASGALVALALRPEPHDPTRAPAIVAVIALVAGALTLLYTPAAARRIASSDNLRMTLVEHAPLLGRAVTLASLIAPPPADDAPDPSLSPPGELPRALDWTGRDLVLITVDALRADHVSSYGYRRPTTPSLDALAVHGARFDAAYCPTPHTSYSIASLMTGKYMRPLVALGLGDDSDTWAGLLRRYGYRTAAFYPPAIFFIDGDRFQALHDRGLDFEYRKEEFASPTLRAKQVAEYLESAPHDKPLFLWVHFFEPHEPYVAHPEHPFGASDIDRYDSEIAAADEGIGAILREVRASRPGAVVIATADHGEEFGEHGGRYHGTTVYEEQVRVPLLIDGPGVAPGTIASVVQTIDLLPTVLSSLGIPRPARLRGRDLGPLLARKSQDGTSAAELRRGLHQDGTSAAELRRGPHEDATDPGLAFAETDEYTLLARGEGRLVCARRASACALFDRAHDPGETHDIAKENPVEARELRRALTNVASEHGRLEHGEEASWPEALRRGIAGDAEAALDVAALLDDANERIRAKAAEVSFDLRVPIAAPAMRRALGEGGRGGSGARDETVRRWAALALVRMGESPTTEAESLLRDPEPSWRRAAALAFAERGDARGAADLAAVWSDHAGLEYVRATEVLAALAKIHDRAAVPALIRSLDDVRFRPFVSDALGEIGDPSASVPLAATLATEAQVTSRVHEARALARLGGASWSGTPKKNVEARLDVPRARGGSALRLVVLGAGEGRCTASLDGASLVPPEDVVFAPAFDVGISGAAAWSKSGGTVTVSVSDDAGVEALFLLAVPTAPDAGAP